MYLKCFDVEHKSFKWFYPSVYAISSRLAIAEVIASLSTENRAKEACSPRYWSAVERGN